MRTKKRDVLRTREHGWLRFNEDREETWSMPDPVDPMRSRAAWTARYELRAMTQTQAFLLAEVFEAYHHLMTHPGGTEYAIGQLRAMRRALATSEPRKLREEDL